MTHSQRRDRDDNISVHNDNDGKRDQIWTVQYTTVLYCTINTTACDTRSTARDSTHQHQGGRKNEPPNKNNKSKPHTNRLLSDLTSENKQQMGPFINAVAVFAVALLALSWPLLPSNSCHAFSSWSSSSLSSPHHYRSRNAKQRQSKRYRTAFYRSHPTVASGIPSNLKKREDSYNSGMKNNSLMGTKSNVQRRRRSSSSSSSSSSQLNLVPHDVIVDTSAFSNLVLSASDVVSSSMASYTTATPATDTSVVQQQQVQLSTRDTWIIFIAGVIPFAVATVEFWRRVRVGEAFGTGKDSVVFSPAVIGKDNVSPLNSRGRRVLGTDALITAIVLFVISFGTLGIVLYAVITSSPPPPPSETLLR